MPQVTIIVEAQQSKLMEEPELELGCLMQTQFLQHHGDLYLCELQAWVLSVWWWWCLWYPELTDACPVKGHRAGNTTKTTASAPDLGC